MHFLAALAICLKNSCGVTISNLNLRLCMSGMSSRSWSLVTRNLTFPAAAVANMRLSSGSRLSVYRAEIDMRYGLAPLETFHQTSNPFFAHANSPQNLQVFVDHYVADDQLQLTLIPPQPEDLSAGGLAMLAEVVTDNHVRVQRNREAFFTTRHAAPSSPAGAVALSPQRLPHHSCCFAPRPESPRPTVDLPESPGTHGCSLSED